MFVRVDWGRPRQGPLPPPEATPGPPGLGGVRSARGIGGGTAVRGRGVTGPGADQVSTPQSQRVPDLFCGGGRLFRQVSKPENGLLVGFLGIVATYRCSSSAGAGRWSPMAPWCPGVPPQSWGWLTPRPPGLVLHHPFLLSGRNYFVPPGRPAGDRAPSGPSSTMTPLRIVATG
ncbi:hypothetical protein NDU88_005920 [Pleurodeles waltl]|uniref:Uncharacterized protein n=1 Tax=Pleurodeles waltl TaxID=8319 RepID=A0AAV7MAS9_PLEWA|nr:hypothetical protein NDU88_005920 [Pleurodeles waltl]